MKRRFLAAFSALALMIPVWAWAQAGPKPRLEMRSMSHNFGEIFHQEMYVHAYTVKNLGDADLEIKAVNPSCGCTAAKFDKTIAPGQEGQIELAIDGAKVHGEFTKTAGVETNDPVLPHLTLTISGKEIPYVNVLPEGTVYLQGRYGEPIEQDLTLASNEKDLDFKVLGITSTIDDKITYVLEDGVKPHEYTLKVYKNPKLPTLSTYGSIFVRTSSTRSPVTTVQVHVMTKGSISLSPTVLNYGAVKFTETAGQETPETKAVTITRAGGQFKIKDVTISNPNYRAVVDPVTPGQQYRVQVTFTPPLRKQAKQTEAGEMIIHTDDPQEPAVRVQLVARSQ